MDPVHKIYRLLLFIAVGYLGWNTLPYLTPIIAMLIFSFLFTTIFLQAVDITQRYIKSRIFSVLLILGSSITLGIIFIGSFVTSLGIQIKIFTQKIQRDDFSIGMENFSERII